MKKMFRIFVSLIFIYIIVQILCFNFEQYEINYIIKDETNNFEITEKYVRKQKNYYIEIKTKDNVFSYQMDANTNKRQIVKDIKYYKDDNMECILPVFKNKIIFDVTCSTNDKIIYYHNMDEKPDELKEFVKKIKDYDENKFIDSSNNETKENIYTIYKYNLIKNHYLAVTNYQGVTNINKKNITTVNIFSKDKYKKPISYFTKDYYVVADYDSTYEFTKFYVVNIKNNSLKELKDYYHISFDSYLQGIIDNSIYLFDLENKKQYEINLDNMTINCKGNIKGIKYYDNGKWIELEANEAIKNKIEFKINNRQILEDGTIIDTIGNNKKGYIYTYVKTNNGYELYKSNIQNDNIKNYLFEIKDIDSVICLDDYIYFKDDDSIYYYNEQTGKRKIIKGDELKFNDNILYTVTK